MAGSGTYGGMSPGFERYGGHRSDTLRVLVESISAQRGTSIDASSSSNVYPEIMAIARVLAECWSTNRRMANQWDVLRMTDFIPRWEAILGIVPADGDSDRTRRGRIAVAFSRIGQSGIYQTVYDELTGALGGNFVGISTQSSGTAAVWTPAHQIVNGFDVGAWDVGSHDPMQLINFYSTVAHITVEVAQLPYQTDGEFYQSVARINPILDTLLPAWVDWSWIRTPSGTPGFYLDSGWPGGAVPAGVTPVNLDNEGLT